MADSRSRPRRLPRDSKPTARRNSVDPQKSLKPIFQVLEVRELLTSTLYIDFGEAFAGGQLADTQGNFDSAAVNGPHFSGVADSDTITLTSFAQTAQNANSGTGLDYNNDGVFNADDVTKLESDVVSLVQRYYQPFDITVAVLHAYATTVNGHSVTGASSLADDTSTLAANNTSTKHNDAYVFVTGTSASPTAISNGLNGQAGGNDIGGTNTTDDTAIVLADHLFRQEAADQNAATSLGYTIAHEAGHTFGLQHTINSGPADTVLLTRSDMISQFANVGVQENLFNMFTRFPLPTVSGTPTDENSAQQYFDDPQIGESGAFAYVTGTGANDIVTVTKADATHATVSVTPYREAAYTNTIADAFIYQIDTTSGILIDLGQGTDRVVIDGSLGTSVSIRGFGGADQLIVNGNGATDANYTPGTTVDDAIDNQQYIHGSIDLFAPGFNTSIAFSEFAQTGSSIIVNGVAELTQTVNNGNAVLKVGNGAAGRDVITGTIGSTPIIPMTIANVSHYTLNTGIGDDTVTIAATPATGLFRFSLNTGAGNDTLIVDSTAGLFSIGGGIQYDGGAGANNLQLLQTGGPVRDLDTYTLLSTPGSGSDVIADGGVAQSVFFRNLAPVFDNVPGPLTVVATDNNNVINYGPGSTATNGLVSVDDGEPIEFTNKTALIINGNGGDDAFNFGSATAPTGLTSIMFQGNQGFNILTVDAFTRAASTTSVNAAVVNIPGATVVPINYAGFSRIFIINSADVLFAPAGPILAAVEGTSTGSTLVGSFRVADVAVPPTVFANANDFTAEINWGDGSSSAGTVVANGIDPAEQFQVFGSHTYAVPGTYTVSMTVTDKGSTRTFSPVSAPAVLVALTANPGATATVNSTAVVADAPLFSSPVGVTGVEGLSLASTSLPAGATDVLTATFTDSNPAAAPGAYIATIDWGDGTVSNATRIVANGSPDGLVFSVFGNHTYAEEGSYPLTVTIRDAEGSRTVASSTVLIADAPLSPGAVRTVDTIESPIFPTPVFAAPIFTGPVASFIDANAAAPAADFRATIDWGDGTPLSLGTIRRDAAGRFTVLGSHTYADAGVNGGIGTYQVIVHISDVGGSSLQVTTTANVADRPVTVTGSLDSASDSGLSDSDGITNVTTPSFSGTTEPYARVTLLAAIPFVGADVPVGQAVAGADGVWHLTTSALAEGVYNVFAIAVDQFGKTTSTPTQIFPNAAGGFLLIDTLGPDITDVYFDHLNGQVDVSYQDNLSGMYLASIVDSSNYSLTKPHLFPSQILATDISPSVSADPRAVVTVPITLNGGKALKGGFYTFTIRSFGPSNHLGIRDVAGNALDGEFYGKFYSGNAEVGGDFVARLDAVHLKLFAPQTVVGTANRFNDGHGGAPVGAVHSGHFTIARPRAATAVPLNINARSAATVRARLAARAVATKAVDHTASVKVGRTAVHQASHQIVLAGQHPKGPVKRHAAR